MQPRLTDGIVSHSRRACSAIASRRYEDRNAALPPNPPAITCPARPADRTLARRLRSPRLVSAPASGPMANRGTGFSMAAWRVRRCVACRPARPRPDLLGDDQPCGSECGPRRKHLAGRDDQRHQLGRAAPRRRRGQGRLPQAPARPRSLSLRRHLPRLQHPPPLGRLFSRVCCCGATAATGSGNRSAQQRCTDDGWPESANTILNRTRRARHDRRRAGSGCHRSVPRAAGMVPMARTRSAGAASAASAARQVSGRLARTDALSAIPAQGARARHAPDRGRVGCGLGGVGGGGCAPLRSSRRTRHIVWDPDRPHRPHSGRPGTCGTGLCRRRSRRGR